MTIPRILASRIAGVACAAFLAATCLAQTTSDEASVKLNVGHRHHEHPHGEPHETTEDASRFHTDRPSPKLLPLPVEKDAFTFVVFGDRTGGPDDGVAVLAEAVRDVNLIEPDFVMTVGDLIQGYNEEPEWLEQMREFKGIMDRLKCPWFPVAGNHDVYWRDSDRSGDERPEGEHEQNYETDFGPLWYAFEHKGAWFIMLYSDEGDPETGEKTFRRPESQQMSDEQFGWLKETLEKAGDAHNVFVFLHHPHWIGEADYGDDWARVHRLLVDAGNVRAVFAGHIHRMRYDGPNDGIEYVTLATVGGGNALTVPRVGLLHHYNLVTVRPDQISMSAIPVGATIDPREITFDLQMAAERLHRTRQAVEGEIHLASDGSASATLTVTLSNPTEYVIEGTATPASRDSRWSFSPEHEHFSLAPGDTHELEVRVTRRASPVDETFRPASIEVACELLTETFRYEIPPTATPLPIDSADIPEPAAVKAGLLEVEDDDRN